MFLFNKPKKRRKKNLVSNAPKVCKLDGKTFCKDGDKPLKPTIGYIGSKSKLSEKIIKYTPPHKKYIEVFAGSASLFLRKPLAQKNVLNDKDGDIMKIHKSFKSGKGFKSCVMYPSKRRFDKIKNKKNKSVCDIAYLNKLSFGNGMKHYSEDKASRKAKDLGISYQNVHIEDYKRKMKDVKILNEDFRTVMKKADEPENFIYADPPYVIGGSSYKIHGVTPQEVCGSAKKLKRAKILISYDNRPEVRKSCSGLKQRTISHTYMLNNQKGHSGGKKVKELLIANYPI